MKTKNVIYVVGATVLVGGGAYLFLKNKKAKDLSKLAQLDNQLDGTTSGGTTTTGGGTTSGGTTTTGGGTTSGGTTTTGGATTSGGTTTTGGTTLTAQQVLDKANEDKAKGLATQIFGLKTQQAILRTQISSMPISANFNTSFNSPLRNLTLQNSSLSLKIKDLSGKIKSLGYKEVNGQAVKLVEVTTTTLV